MVIIGKHIIHIIIVTIEDFVFLESNIKDQRYVDIIFALFIIFRNESCKIKSVLLDAQKRNR